MSSCKSTKINIQGYRDKSGLFSTFKHSWEAPTDRLFFGTIRKTTKDHSQQSLQISTIQMD